MIFKKEDIAGFKTRTGKRVYTILWPPLLKVTCYENITGYNCEVDYVNPAASTIEYFVGEFKLARFNYSQTGRGFLDGLNKAMDTDMKYKLIKTIYNE